MKEYSPNLCTATILGLPVKLLTGKADKGWYTDVYLANNPNPEKRWHFTGSSANESFQAAKRAVMDEVIYGLHPEALERNAEAAAWHRLYLVEKSQGAYDQEEEVDDD